LVRECTRRFAKAYELIAEPRCGCKVASSAPRGCLPVPSISSSPTHEPALCFGDASALRQSPAALPPGLPDRVGLSKEQRDRYGRDFLCLGQPPTPSQGRARVTPGAATRCWSSANLGIMPVMTAHNPASLRKCTATRHNLIGRCLRCSRRAIQGSDSSCSFRKNLAERHALNGSNGHQTHSAAVAGMNARRPGRHPAPQRPEAASCKAAGKTLSISLDSRRLPESAQNLFWLGVGFISATGSLSPRRLVSTEHRSPARANVLRLTYLPSQLSAAT